MSEETKDDMNQDIINQDNTNQDNKSNNQSDYEDVCFICRRAESSAGEMFKLPNNICVCSDCMRKTMDTVTQFDYQGMLSDPGMLDEMTKNLKGGFPNIKFLNISDLQGSGGIPNKQKIKKKSKEPLEPIDLKKIPSPHVIKSRLDEYVCGQEHAKKVISVEINKFAHRNAIENAKRNNVENIEFYCDDAGEFINKYDGNIDMVIMDPPRKGSDERFLSTLINKNIKQIVYISCDPETLARDLLLLSEFYEVKTVQPVDMFPMTCHIETVVSLIKKGLRHIKCNETSPM